MIFFKNGLHMVAIKEGSVINIQPNPKFVKDNVKYGAILLNDKPIGVYPLKEGDTPLASVYEVFRMICKQINAGDKIISLPNSYKFSSLDEYHQFEETMKAYSGEEMIDVYYAALSDLNMNS